MTEITSLKMISHKDPKDLLMRNVDLTVGIDGKDHDYKRKIPVEDVLLEVILVLKRIENARLTFNKEKKDALQRRDEKGREPETPSSLDSDGQRSPEKGKGSAGKEVGTD